MTGRKQVIGEGKKKHANITKEKIGCTSVREIYLGIFQS
jgi:hypothetical protein